MVPGIPWGDKVCNRGILSAWTASGDCQGDYHTRSLFPYKYHEALPYIVDVLSSDYLTTPEKHTKRKIFFARKIFQLPSCQTRLPPAALSPKNRRPLVQHLRKRRIPVSKTSRTPIRKGMTSMPSMTGSSHRRGRAFTSIRARKVSLLVSGSRHRKLIKTRRFQARNPDH